ncbi:hypothetical protein CHRY9390_02242 [Chryseobacterium aquaeductus]|uniref:Uncharacterized protein n=2 Tax=Chryseobacterium aquaeductus TaxID=2675056 RepID=A0A9N8MGU2_9FLAO|nr:hypothetical protein CHRY9390_02242 [Chryseobacterium potabilaquae]CAD7810809.1 hypothetical protein CHRY9390_02242 [Chryseobacterium aquaeductus]
MTKKDFQDKIINNTLWGEKTEVTDELVDYYRTHPEELDLIIDKELFYGRFIKFFFFLGIVVTVLSRVLMFVFADTWAAFINEVVLDIFSEFGIAIFGGAITTFLLEQLNQKQYEQNIALRKEILDRIKQSNSNSKNDKNSENK